MEATVRLWLLAQAGCPSHCLVSLFRALPSLSTGDVPGSTSRGHLTHKDPTSGSTCETKLKVLFPALTLSHSFTGCLFWLCNTQVDLELAACLTHKSEGGSLAEIQRRRSWQTHRAVGRLSWKMRGDSRQILTTHSGLTDNCHYSVFVQSKLYFTWGHPVISEKSGYSLILLLCKSVISFISEAQILPGEIAAGFGDRSLHHVLW